jgi:hypothetical protein
MSFLPAVQREINNRQPNDPVRLALEFLSQRGVGYQNSIPLRDIVAHLQAQGVNISEAGFQQTVLATSRDADFFIGAGNRGYFLINTIDDARVMRDFYETRIHAEQQNLDNLRRQSVLVGWNL